MTNMALAEQIQEHLEAVIQRSSSYAKELWQEFHALHPADKALVLTQLTDAEGQQLFRALDKKMQVSVFQELSDVKKVSYLSALSESDRRNILSSMSIDALTDFFDELSDETLEQYLGLLQKKSRKRVLSLLQFKPETAGDVMRTSVVTLLDSFSVAKAVEIIQRLQPDRQLHQTMYVTDQDNKLVGYVYLEDLVVHKPQERIRNIMRKDILTVNPDQDQEEVARQMSHYHLTNVPVVDKDEHFLGVISADALVDILERESSEDIYRMATMNPVHTNYFETPIYRLVYQRASILIILLLAQSISSAIMQRYEQTLTAFLYIFTTMLASAGGNTSSQTSALVIQGLATQEINQNNKWHFLGREFWIAAIIALLMSTVGFLRAYLVKGGTMLAALAVSASLGAIVMSSVVLGSLIPFLLNRMNMDPAHSAGPLLATLMDIVGIYVFCAISHAILGI